ncbi:MAG: HDIG domain-containing protein [Firmicutes bacterium]|nr:HDIG domain-containing protein [Bacillota bacterium]
MNRVEALKTVESKIQNKNLVKHMLAVEVCMRSLAKKFGEDEEKWALAGLLHDLDYDETKDDFSKHGILSAEILEEKGAPVEVIEAIKAHPGHFPRNSKMAKALYAVDPLTGLIVAATLMHPDKKLEPVTTQFVMNRSKEKHFARGANREQIKSCEELGLTVEEFVDISLAAMKTIGKDLGL